MLWISLPDEAAAWSYLRGIQYVKNLEGCSLSKNKRAKVEETDQVTVCLPALM